MVDNSSSDIRVNPSQGGDFRSKRPSPTKPKKNFKKILEKEEQDHRDQPREQKIAKDNTPVKGKETYEEVTQKLEEWDKTSKTSKVSLFDLAKSEKVEEKAPKEAEVPELSEDVHKESLSALLKGFGSKEKLQALQQEALQKTTEKPDTQRYLALEDSLAVENREDIAGVPSPTKKSTAPSEAKIFPFSEEKGDLSTVNPMVGTAASSGASQVKGAEPTRPTIQIQEMIDQIIDKLYTIKAKGQTDTLVTLRHPPMFAGTKVVIKSFETAKREFNISFENLTQAAKQILDSQENRNALISALNQKGFTIHILTTTTLSETFTVAEGEQTEQEDRQGRREKNDKDEKQ